jgi:hypothetical protein
VELLAYVDKAHGNLSGPATPLGDAQNRPMRDG